GYQKHVNKQLAEQELDNQIKEEIMLSKAGINSVLVEHPVIMNNELAQTIKVEDLYINHYWKSEKQPGKIEFI
ncbi:hypothetical protein HYE55_00280, partial [Aggregatibacter actinomycetemcomitans]|nr:hypothetical protein [Aggregatibacter actinomycetemcomitans]